MSDVVATIVVVSLWAVLLLSALGATYGLGCLLCRAVLLLFGSCSCGDTGWVARGERSHSSSGETWSG